MRIKNGKLTGGGFDKAFPAPSSGKSHAVPAGRSLWNVAAIAANGCTWSTQLHDATGAEALAALERETAVRLRGEYAAASALQVAVLHDTGWHEAPGRTFRYAIDGATVTRIDGGRS